MSDEQWLSDAADAAANAAYQNAVHLRDSDSSDDHETLYNDPGVRAALAVRQKKPKKGDPQARPHHDPDKPAKKPVVDYKNPERIVAEDGQSLNSQNTATQAMFRARYAERAEIEWVKEHEKELEANRRVYGTSEPPPGMKKAPVATTTALLDNEQPATPSAPATAKPGATIVDGLIASYKPPTTNTTAPPGVAPSLNGSPTTLTDPIPTTPTTPATTTPTPSTVSPTPKSEDDDIVIKNKTTGQTMKVKRGHYQATPDQNSPKYGPGSYTPANWEIIEEPSQPVQTAATPGAGVETYDPSKDPNERPGKFTPERNIVGYDPKTGETYDPTTVRTPTGQYVPGTNSGSLPLEDKPIATLARLSVRRQGGDPAAVRQEEKRILDGIGALIRGEKEGVWAEPYLNDVARVAWAKQQAQNGIQADPRDTPMDYIEKWKDAFFGSDPSVPLVKELDQQMIDNAVVRTPSGQTKFDWRQAYGDPNSAGTSSIISKQITDRDCGTNAFANILRSRGYNIDPTQSYNYGRKYGYHNGEQFTGPANFARMLKQEAGIDAEFINGVPKDVIDAELDAGRPVTFSSSTHYWTAAAYRDTENGREYYVGATGASVGNPQWARLDQLHYGGASPNAIIVARGEVDKNARAVTELGLRPPGPTGPVRENLSRMTREAEALTARQERRNRGEPEPTVTTTNMRNSSSMTLDIVDSSAAPYHPIIEEASKDEGVDPYWIAAMLEQESGGKITAESEKGARGLMQLMPDTARALGVTNSDDPQQNIRGGTKYFRQQLDQFDGDIDLALAAYNAGPGAVMKHGGIPPYAQTVEYVKKVKERYNRLKQEAAARRSR